MGEWIADASFIIHGAKVRARDEREADDVVYGIAEDELFDDYVPLDAESTNVSMSGAKLVPGSENSRGVPLMTGDVRVSLYGMIVYGDSVAEAEEEVRDALNDWAPAKFPFDGGREELVITSVRLSDDDEDDYDDDDDVDSWNVRSRSSGRPARPKASASRKGNPKGRSVSDSPKSKSKAVSRSVKASRKAKSAKGRGSCNTKPKSKATSQPRKANGQFAKKPRTSRESSNRRR